MQQWVVGFQVTNVASMGRQVDVDDLVDAHEVAILLGLAQPNSVYLYQRRHPEMPRPVVDRGPRRAKLWLQSEIIARNQSHVSRVETKPAKQEDTP
jgi:predicted DNA-binding transcriptional regulator AlpA